MIVFEFNPLTLIEIWSQCDTTVSQRFRKFYRKMYRKLYIEHYWTILSQLPNYKITSLKYLHWEKESQVLGSANHEFFLYRNRSFHWPHIHKSKSERYWKICAKHWTLNIEPMYQSIILIVKEVFDNTFIMENSNHTGS